MSVKDVIIEETGDRLKIEAIGKRLRTVRGNLSQKSFGEAVGISRSYVSDVENGRVKPSLEYLVAVAEHYDVSLDWVLLGRETAGSNVIDLVDADLREMQDYLQYAWIGANSDMRGWIKIQFQNAFSGFMGWRQKKEPSAAGEGTPNGA